MTIAAEKLSWYLSWKGLLGTKRPKTIYFQTRYGIHTFGMRYAIDVVIMDNQYTVRQIKEHLLPNRIFFWNPFFYRVLELPQGTIKQKHISLGTKLFIDYSPSVGGIL